MLSSYAEDLEYLSGDAAEAMLAESDIFPHGGKFDSDRTLQAFSTVPRNGKRWVIFTDNRLTPHTVAHDSAEALVFPEGSDFGAVDVLFHRIARENRITVNRVQ